MPLKRCMCSRKALSHVDWAMSLAIFLLYLAWFFIFVKPVIVPAESIGSLTDVLQDGLEENIFDDLQRIYIFIPQSASDSTAWEPIIVDFSQSWPDYDIAHTADYFEIDDGRMLFLANLSASNRYAAYYPLDTVRRTEEKKIIANEDEASWASFTASFDEQLLDHVRFGEISALDSFGVEVDDDDFDGDGEFANLSLVAKYHSEGDSANNTAYVFAENPRIYSFIEPNDNMNHSVDLSFVFYNYSYFYFNDQDSGKLTFSIAPRCKYYKADSLNLYSAGSGVLITFGREISFGLCTNETDILLDLEFTLTDEDSYSLYFYEGDPSDMEDYPITPVEGVVESLKVVSRDKVNLLKNKDYDYLKQLFSYPDQKDFNISISGSYTDASYGVSRPQMADVYAAKLETFALDQDLEQQRVSIAMNVW